jgi:hypothetical protein
VFCECLIARETRESVTFFTFSLFLSFFSLSLFLSSNRKSKRVSRGSSKNAQRGRERCDEETPPRSITYLYIYILSLFSLSHSLFPYPDPSIFYLFIYLRITTPTADPIGDFPPATRIRLAVLIALDNLFFFRLLLRHQHHLLLRSFARHHTCIIIIPR